MSHQVELSNAIHQRVKYLTADQPINPRKKNPSLQGKVSTTLLWAWLLFLVLSNL